MEIDGLKKTEEPPNSKTVKGAEIAIKCLEHQGVKQIFAYPGEHLWSFTRLYVTVLLK